MNWVVIAIVVVVFAIWAVIAIIGSIAKSISTSIDNANKKSIEKNNKLKINALEGFVSENKVEYPVQFMKASTTVSSYPLEEYIQNIKIQLKSISPPKVIEFKDNDKSNTIKTTLDVSLLESLHKLPMKNIFAEYEKLICSYPEKYTVSNVNIEEPEEPSYRTLEYDFPRLQEIHIKGKYPGTIKQVLIEKQRDIEEEYEQNLSKHEKILSSIEESNILLKDGYDKAVECYQQAKSTMLDIKKRYELQYTNAKNAYINACYEKKNYYKSVFKGYSDGTTEGVEDYFFKLISNLYIPYLDKKSIECHYSNEQKIIAIDIVYPSIERFTLFKTVVLKKGATEKSLNQRESKYAHKLLYITPAILFSYFTAINDVENLLECIVINGWVDAINKATGKIERKCTLSVFIKKNDIGAINIRSIDPVATFENFKGVYSSQPDLNQAPPVMCFNKNDKRIVDGKDVISGLDSSVNIASMDWSDFEHLIRQLFELEFIGKNAEVKVTQASRDKGVDALIFDNDPIHGGKIVIQAKRYVNTVDVSSVRDLYGTVINEGATKGILVTTSQFGSDSYDFVKDKPLVLVDGSNLLSLLARHNLRYRINIDEARKTLSAIE